MPAIHHSLPTISPDLQEIQDDHYHWAMGHMSRCHLHQHKERPNQWASFGSHRLPTDRQDRSYSQYKVDVQTHLGLSPKDQQQTLDHTHQLRYVYRHQPYQQSKGLMQS